MPSLGVLPAACTEVGWSVLAVRSDLGGATSYSAYLRCQCTSGVFRKRCRLRGYIGRLSSVRPPDTPKRNINCILLDQSTPSAISSERPPYIAVPHPSLVRAYQRQQCLLPNVRDPSRRRTLLCPLPFHHICALPTDLRYSLPPLPRRTWDLLLRTRWIGAADTLQHRVRVPTAVPTYQRCRCPTSRRGGQRHN